MARRSPLRAKEIPTKDCPKKVLDVRPPIAIAERSRLKGLQPCGSRCERGNRGRHFAVAEFVRIQATALPPPQGCDGLVAPRQTAGGIPAPRNQRSALRSPLAVAELVRIPEAA